MEAFKQFVEVEAIKLYIYITKGKRKSKQIQNQTKNILEKKGFAVVKLNRGIQQFSMQPK